MSKKILFIYNPKAGTGAVGLKLSDIVQVFSAGGFNVEVYPTASRDDARTRVEKCESFIDCIVVSGGDGTLNEAVTGYLRAGLEIPMGYIPTGSTNDFASSVGIAKDPIKAASDIVEGSVNKLDVGAFADRNFVYVAAFGAFTSVAYGTDQALKNTLGHMAYLINGLRELSVIRSFQMKFYFDGEEKSGKYIYGMVTNSKSVGGFKNITGKNVEMSDGLFEVTLIKNIDNLIFIPEIIADLLSGTPDSRHIERYTTDSIIFESEELLPWTLDGEFGGEHEKVKISNLHNKLPMLINVKG